MTSDAPVLPQPDSRPTSAASFDAGINASSAWAEALEASSIDGDDVDHEPGVNPATASDDDEPAPRSARALFDFDGKPEFRELVVQAGDELMIVKENLAEGWSLAQFKEELGLIPDKYYTFTTDFAPVASGGQPPHHPATATTPTTTTMQFPLQPQLTGPYFASLRQTLLGGKSLNRFSNFVTSGAEDWVLNGGAEEESSEEDMLRPPRRKHQKFGTASSATSNLSDEGKSTVVDGTSRHYVDMPPAWRSKTRPFQVLVHSPSKHTSPLTGSYTLYTVTSLFRPDTPRHSRFSSSSSTITIPSASTSSRTITQSTLAVLPEHVPDENAVPTVHVTVQRRFSHFIFLHRALTRSLPGIALPPLPDKQYSGRFNDDFIEARRADLEKWLSRVVRHPLVRFCEVMIFFLSCDNDTEWRRNLPKYLAPPPAPGPAFYGQVYHPEFNLDADEVEETVDRFDHHLIAVGQGVQGLRAVFGKVREANIEMSVAQRALSYSILSLITSTPVDQSVASPSTPSLAYALTQWEADEDDEDESPEEKRKGLMNDEGAWCWRDGCEECLHRTKALQRLAETLQIVADSYDDHARRTQFATHDAIKDLAHPKSLYAGVMDTHRSTLSTYTEVTTDPNPSLANSDKATRCETVLNTTMAEFDAYHVQKGEDFDRIAIEHLDGEIAFHEQALRRLKAARANFEKPEPNINFNSNFAGSRSRSGTITKSSFSAASSSSSSAFPISPTSASTVRSFASVSYQPLPPGPRKPSIYERDLAANQTRLPAPLTQPTPHISDYTGAMRPVTAVKEGVNYLATGIRGSAMGIPSMVGGVTIPGLQLPPIRGSVFDFGRLWSSGA